jgi:hypothetical protein
MSPMPMISGQSGHKFRPVQKKESNQKDLKIFEERTDRIRKAFASIRLDYNPINYPERYAVANEKINLHLQQEYDEKYITRRLLGIKRVKLPIPLFENSEGEIDDTVKSAIIYRVQVEIEKEDSYKAGARGDLIHSHLFKIGSYEKPNPRYKFNEKHEIIDSRVVGSTRRYYIADTKENIEAVLQRFGEPMKAHPWTVAVAHPSGSAYYLNDETMIIGDFDEWLNNDIQTLIDYSKSGVMELGKKRLEAFKQFKLLQDEKLSKGVYITPKDFMKNQEQPQNNKK